MGTQENIGLLFQHASQYRFEEFDALFSELKVRLSPEAMWEAYLMRAQIKLFASDQSIMDDLEIVKQTSSQPKFACLNTVWGSDSANRLIVCGNMPGSLMRFLGDLPRAREVMSALYGEPGDVMVRQMLCNVFYFVGKIEEALLLAEEPFSPEYDNPTDDLLMRGMRYRCYLALGETSKAEQCIMEIIRFSRRYPECVAPYRAFRGWANITTSWSGDSPRFYRDKMDTPHPVLEDRLELIRDGASRTTRLEAPFVNYATRHYADAYPLREFYMDLFHAIYWLSIGDRHQIEMSCALLCDMVNATGIITPVVECGEHAAALLRYLSQNALVCSKSWLDKVISMAQQYEQTLEAYRSIHT